MKGFTLLEILIAMFILSLIVMATGTFARNVIIYNTAGQNSLTAQLEGRRVLRTMVSELRTSVPSALGAYPIETAATNTIIFFTDLDEDGLPERIRYFLDSVTRAVKRGVVSPSGFPLVYNLGSESVTTLISSVVNSTSTPMFDYYSAVYAGTTTAMALPINIASVRLVRMNVLIDKDQNRSPNTIYLISSVMFRNLKDNL